MRLPHESDAPRQVAEIPVMSVSRSPFDVATGGRILLLERTVTQGAAIAVVTDWLAAATGRRKILRGDPAR